MKNNWLYIGVILVLVAATVMLWETPPQDLLPLGTDEEKPVAFAYATLEDAHTQRFDENGELSYEFNAKTIYHYRLSVDDSAPGDYTELVEPQLTLLSKGKKWLVSAERGILEQQGEILTLHRNVRILRPDPNEEDIELSTDQLEVYPQQKTAKTDHKVLIQSPNGAIEGVGMNIDLSTQNIQLLSQVTGHYETANPQ